MTSICPICGYEGRPKQAKRGSSTMEWIIYLTLLVPGPFYSAWRRMGLPKICPNCSADRMVRIDSDAGRIAQKQWDAKLGIEPIKRAPSPKPQPQGVVLSDASFSQPTKQEAEKKPKPPVDPDVW
jgi:hypothetical protein